MKGFEQMNWQRGNQSFIFRGGSKCIESIILPCAQVKTFRKESGNAEVKHFNQRSRLTYMTVKYLTNELFAAPCCVKYLYSTLTLS